MQTKAVLKSQLKCSKGFQGGYNKPGDPFLLYSESLSHNQSALTLHQNTQRTLATGHNSLPSLKKVENVYLKSSGRLLVPVNESHL